MGFKLNFEKVSSKDLFILGVVNSDVGKPGNIGVRYAYVKNELDALNVFNVTYARGNYAKLKNVKTLSFLAYLVRLFHYLRRNFLRKFNSRKIDILFFETMFFASIWWVLVCSRKYRHKVAYVVESSPRIMGFLKRRGFKVLYDVPIAPNSYVLDALKKNPDCGLVYQKYLDEMERKCVDVASEILVPSAFVMQEIEKLSKEPANISIIPFGVKANQERKQELDKGSGIDFVFAGNISSRKGIAYLLKCWSRPEFSGDRLHLCGTMTREISSLIKTHKLTNIITPGFVDTSKYLPHCDVYVFPSLMEGSSKSIFEAMSAALPCIVTPQSGSIVEDYVTGLVVDAFSVPDLYRAMVEIKKMDIMAMGSRAKKHADEYTWERYVDNVIKVIRG